MSRSWARRRRRPWVRSERFSVLTQHRDHAVRATGQRPRRSRTDPESAHALPRRAGPEETMLARMRLSRSVAAVALSVNAILLGEACSDAEPDPIDLACARRADATVSNPRQLEAQRSYVMRTCTADARAPGSTITVEHIDRCTTALVGRDPCLRNPPMECVPPAGTLPMGAACVSGHQCNSGACSARPPACGRCVEARGVGVECVGRECSLGLECRQVTRPPRCGAASCAGGTARCELPARDSEPFSAQAELGEIGDPCVTDYSCRFTLRCVGGKCAGAKLGDRCHPVAKTALLLDECEQGLRCDEVTGTCVEATLSDGENCGGPSRHCRPGTRCGGSSGILPVCARLPALGERCGISDVCALGPRGESVTCYLEGSSNVGTCRLSPPSRLSEAQCRAGTAPACTACTVIAIGKACGYGTGTGHFGEVQAGDPTCDQAASCVSSVCRPADLYACSRD